MILVFWCVSLLVFWASIFSSSPMVLTIMLILYAAILGAMTWLTLSKWLMMAILLIFLGGMMIIFMYAVTLVPNNKFILYFNKSLFVVLFTAIFMHSMMTFNYSTPSMESISSELFMSLTRFSLFFLTSYLLITLFSVVKISEGFKGALSKSF